MWSALTLTYIVYSNYVRLLGYQLIVIANEEINLIVLTRCVPFIDNLGEVIYSLPIHTVYYSFQLFLMCVLSDGFYSFSS